MHQLLVVSDITILYIYRRPCQFCEISAVVTNCVTNSSRWFCDSLWKVVNTGREF